MATTIKLKNGSGAPLAGDLVQGEPAFDLTNKRLYTEDSGGTVIEVGTNPTSLTTGTFTSTGIDDNATSTAITIDSSQNVGIGETTPSATLTKATITTGLVAEGTVPGFCIQDTSGADNAGYWFQENGTMVFQNYGSGNTIFRTGSGGTETIRINSSGNVGIGTASPASLLSVTGGTGEHLVDIQGAGSSFDLQLNSGNAGTVSSSMYSLALYYGATKNSAIDFYRGTGGTDGFLTLSTSNTERFRIDSSGNVGIGTTSPDANLEIRKDNASGLGAVLSLTNSNTSGLTGNSVAIGLSAYTHTTVDNAGYRGAIIKGETTVAGNGHSLIFETSDTSAAPTERMRIDHDGNVGIGTTSPQQMLHLSGSVPEIRYTDTTGNEYRAGNNNGKFRIYDQTAASDRLVIDSSGRVGIGTTSPAYKLDIYGDSSSNVDVLHLLNENVTSGNSVGVMFENYSGGGLNQGRIKYLNSGSNNSNSFVFEQEINGVNGLQETMRIDSSGNVIAGGTSAQAANAVTLMSDGEVTAAGFYFSNNIGSAMNDTGIRRATTSTMVFDTGSTERMRIDSSGNVGIGTTSPAHKLVVSNGGAEGIELNYSTGASFVQSYNRSTSSFLPLSLFASQIIFGAGSSGTEKVRIDSSGDVFIGTTGPTVDISNFGTRIAGSAPGYLASYRNVSGTQSAVLFGGNAGQVFIRGDGDLENTNNSYGAISDERVKSNIVDASSQIDDIMAVQVRSYTLNETGETHIGVVAQELEASGMSGLVQEDEEGMKSVKYSILYMKAIKALQEAVTRIETLEAEVAALKGA